jgi:hypothetical protein
MEGSGPPPDVYGDYGSISSADEPLFVALSAIALSQLQLVLDRSDAKVNVCMDESTDCDYRAAAAKDL